MSSRTRCANALYNLAAHQLNQATLDNFSDIFLQEISVQILLHRIVLLLN